MQSFRLACPWLTLAIACGHVAAAEPVTVQIMGTRYDQRREDTASTIVLGRAQLAVAGDRTLAEALQRVPGITVDATGRGTEIRMRGLGTGYTQVLLNGVPAPAGFSVDTLAPELVEKVEIVRAASAELGTQAIAGTVNIVLRKSAGKAGRELNAAIERLGRRWSPRAGAQWSGKDAYWSWLAGVNVQRTAQPERQLQQERGSDGARDTVFDSLGVVDTAALTPRLTWKPDDTDTVTSQSFASVTRRRTALTGRETLLAGAATDFPELDSRFRARATLLRSDLTWLHRFDPGATLELTAGASHHPRTTDFTFAGNAGGATTTRHVQADIGDDLLLTKGKFTAVPVGHHALVAGWDVSRGDRKQTRVEQEYAPDGTVNFALDQRYRGRIDRTAFYVQDDWRAGAWSLSAGLRHETLATTIAGAAGTRQASRLWSPVLQAALKLAADTTWRAGVSRTFKASTMFELIPRRYTADNGNSATNPDTEGNPALRPELAWGIDTGIERYLGADALVGASAYARRIDDVTLQQLYRDGARWISRPANSGRASTHGVALEARLALTPALSMRADVARNWSRVAAIPGPDNRLDRQAPVSGTLGLDYRTGALALGANFGYQGAARARPAARLTTATSAQRKLDAYAAWQVAPGWRLRIDAINLLRQDSVARRTYFADADASADGGDWREAVTATQTRTALRIGLEIRQ